MKQYCLIFYLFCLANGHAFAQLDTTAVLNGTWDLVQSSAGFGYMHTDSCESYATSFDSDHTIELTQKKITFHSRTMLPFLNDSIIRHEQFKLRRKGSYLVLKRKKESSLMIIEKLTFDELVLSEQKEHTLPFLFIETKYYYKKRTNGMQMPNYDFVGDWFVNDTCATCPFWKDTIVLQADTNKEVVYGNNHFLSIYRSDNISAKHNTFSVTTSYMPEPDTSDTYSSFYSYSYSKGVKQQPWILDPKKRLLYFYPDYASDTFVTYLIQECIPNKKLVLVKVD